MTYTREEIEEKCKSAFEEAAAGIEFPEIKPDSKIALDLEIDSSESVIINFLAS